VEKLVYLLWRRDGEEPAALREALLGEGATRRLAAGARALRFSFADLAPELGGGGLVMGDGPRLAAVAELWLDCLDERAPLERVLAEGGRELDGYLVTESVPQPCRDRDWPDGVRSPGVSHFTWFPKPEALSDEQFFRGWHEQHTPLSFELHPLRWQYVRNSVARALTPGAPPVRAIVTERFRELGDYLDPKRLYGSRAVMKRMLAELPNFADARQMHSVPLSEYILSSAPWEAGTGPAAGSPTRSPAPR
jgi:hypothetical protein